MYIFPQKYKCIKCDHEFEYSPSHKHSCPVLEKTKIKENGVHVQSLPICPNCWTDFLLNNVGIGYCTTAWDVEGSDYDNAKKELK